MAKAVPEGYTTITASLTFKNAERAIDFYRKALGAEERYRMTTPEGNVLHSELRIGTSVLMLCDEVFGQKSVESLGGSPASFYLYVEDADAALARAVSAGGKELMSATDMFWGDRVGACEDPFGFHWSFATHVRDVEPEEMKKGQSEWLQKVKSSRT